MSLPEHGTTIVVASQRGGCMKTTLAALLAAEFARGGMDALLLDASRAGGAFSLQGPEWAAIRPEENAGLTAARRHATLPLVIAHAPEGILNRGLIGAARAAIPGFSADLTIADLPAVSDMELDVALQDASLLLVPVACDAIALKTLVPFMEFIRELRARPGREFAVKAVLAGVGRGDPERAAFERFAQEHLAPILSGAVLPWDDTLAAHVSAARFPDQDASQGVSSNIHLLAEEVLLLLNAAEAAPT